MRVFLINPSHVSFGTAVITPRWLYVLAAATPSRSMPPSLDASIASANAWPAAVTSPEALRTRPSNVSART